MTRKKCLLVGLTTLALLAGCTSGGTPSETEEPTLGASTTASSDPGSSEALATACDYFGDAITVATNVDSALDSGRMTTGETQDWYRLVTRLIDRMPAQEDPADQEIIAAAKERHPRAERGQGSSISFDTEDWQATSAEMHTLCYSHGLEIAIDVLS